MLKKLCLIFIVLGCKPVDFANKRSHFIDSAVMPYYDRFNDETGIQPYKISAYLDKLPKEIGGICWTKFQVDNTMFRYIVFNADFWDYLNDLGKEQLVFHELGHCVLNRDHRKDLFKRTLLGRELIPASIMYPVAFGMEDFYQEYRDFYIDELVKGHKKK